jgi:hypothetical protein
MKAVFALVAALSLVGCGGGGSEGGLTADENAELNNAAAMLDSAPESLNGVDETGLDTGAENQPAPKTPSGS